MSLFDKIKKSAADRRTVECTIFGENVLCRLHSKKSIKEVQKSFSGEDGEGQAVLASQFLDPGTMEPVITSEFLEEDCSQKDAVYLLELFMKLNGFSDDSLEDSEKN